jgi:GNAT superfamily N-acetyltransferase
MINYAVESEPRSEDVLRLDDLLYAYNVERTGLTDGRWLAMFLRAGDGEVIGGIFGWTWGRTCYVDKLYLPVELRGQGEGRRLMCAVETEALNRGCERMVLRTLEFQAPDFYRKLGFVPVCEVEFLQGYRSITLMKRLCSKSDGPTATWPATDP